MLQSLRRAPVDSEVARVLHANETKIRSIGIGREDLRSNTKIDFAFAFFHVFFYIGDRKDEVRVGEAKLKSGEVEARRTTTSCDCRGNDEKHNYDRKHQ